MSTLLSSGDAHSGFKDEAGLVARPLLGESGQRNSPRTSNLIAGTLSPGTGGGAGHQYRQGNTDALIAGSLGADHGNVRADQAWTGRLVPTLTAKCGEQTGRETETGHSLIARPLRARHNASHRADSDTYVAHTLRAEGHDASEDGSGRGAPLVVSPLTASHAKQADSSNTSKGPPNLLLAPLVADTLRSHPRPGSNSVGALAYDMQNGGLGELCGTLQSEGQASGNRGYGVLGFAFNQRREGRLQDVAGAVHEPSGTQVDGAVTPMGVRRLTPTEAERLQALPDGWTETGKRADGSTYRLKDAPRYRLLGNAVTASVGEWLARRILAVVEGTPA